MLKQIGEWQHHDYTFRVYKGSFISIVDHHGQVTAGLLPNESLIIDQYLQCEIVRDEIAQDLIKGIDNEYESIRGFRKPDRNRS